MRDLIAVSKIEKILLKYLNPIFLDTKYEIIRIKVYETKNKIVQIMIDHSNKIIDIEDCAKYSRMISEFLDKKNLISHDFSLEVSSPGIDRPLTRLKDFYEFKHFLNFLFFFVGCFFFYLILDVLFNKTVSLFGLILLSFCLDLIQQYRFQSLKYFYLYFF